MKLQRIERWRDDQGGMREVGGRAQVIRCIRNEDVGEERARTGGRKGWWKKDKVIWNASDGREEEARSQTSPNYADEQKADATDLLQLTDEDRHPAQPSLNRRRVEMLDRFIPQTLYCLQRPLLRLSQISISSGLRSCSRPSLLLEWSSSDDVLEDGREDEAPGLKHLRHLVIRLFPDPLNLLRRRRTPKLTR